MFINLNEYDLVKAITRNDAKKVHKDLPEGGVWRTMNGHHIYIKDGKVLAGAIPSVTGAKKATKYHLADHQATIDKEAKKGKKKDVKTNEKASNPKPSKQSQDKRAGAKGTDKGKTTKEASGSAKPTKKEGGVNEVSTKPKTTSTGAGRGSKNGPKSSGKSTTTEKPSATKSGSKAPKTVEPKGAKKGATTKPTSKTKKGNEGAGKNATESKGAGKPVSGAKKGTSEGGTKGKSTAKKGSGVKDIRHDAQKNRALAYDVGDKVGGARKDEFIASFKANPTAVSLEELEKMSGAVAEKMVTKANLLPAFSFENEHENGVELPTAILKKLLFDRIAPKPDPSTPETRKAYMTALTKFNRQIAGIKTWDNMKNAVRELSEYARNTSSSSMASWARTIQYQTKRANGISDYERFPLTQEEIDKAKKLKDEYEARLAKGIKDKRAFNFEALGEKFDNFFTNWDSRDRTIQTVQKNMKDGWDKYLSPQAKAKPKKEKGAENKVWERKAEAEHLRTGGKKIALNKPEELMKNFGVRGVEFGNWVNDSSGKYHLQRCGEAFQDLADVLGVDPKDISLNGRLAIAFGARGKGGALAHYEPDRKVINMTKYGGAGSLAHEWGHAMDNILYQYSNGGQESLGHASDGGMGDTDPKLKALYDNLMETVSKPAPGEKGGSVQILLDSSTKSLSRYFPEMRRQINSDMKPEDVYNHWAGKINEQYDRAINNAKHNSMRSPQDKEKVIKQYEQKRKRELNDLPHYLAKELQLKQNGGKWGGDHYKGHIEVPTGKSEYMTRLEQTQPNKMQNGAHYWSQPAEVFARVFESYIQDKLKAQGRYNNYLVSGTGEAEVKALGAPFPLGKERQLMHKAMENLLSHISKGGALKKALILEVLASGNGDMTEELRKSQDYHYLNDHPKRSAYNVADASEVIYIPINRLKVVHQTEQATNWDKVQENVERMVRGENLEPVVIGFDYDLHDGHHRYEASHLADYTHVPCVVMNTPDEIGRLRAIESYQELWKSIIPDPAGNGPFEDEEPYMFRGIGQKELDFIQKNGYIQTKGKGNDDDKGTVYTCFSNLYRQALGYAVSNYGLYNEKQAYVIALPKYSYMEEDEHGELITPYRVPSAGMKVIPIPREIR